MTVLASGEIWRALEEGANGRGLVITPLVPEQVQPASVDLRLGNRFILFRKANIPTIDSENIPALHPAAMGEPVQVPSNRTLVLHPHQFLLGATLEYIKLPPDILGYVTGKSTLGRLGLLVATAVSVSPGFSGVITLELLNAGEVPILLHPGQEIAQIILHRTAGRADYAGRYRCPTWPEMPKPRR